MDYVRGADYQQIDLLQRILDAIKLGQPPGSVQVTQEYITQQAAIQVKRMDAIKYMLATALPSTPTATEPITVTTAGVLLYENQSEPLIRITVSNDDIAQPMWIGPQGVNHLTGQKIPGMTWRPFVMPIGSSLWGITDVGFISARVGLAYNIKAILDSIFPE